MDTIRLYPWMAAVLVFATGTVFGGLLVRVFDVTETISVQDLVGLVTAFGTLGLFAVGFITIWHAMAEARKERSRRKCLEAKPLELILDRMVELVRYEFEEYWDTEFDRKDLENTVNNTKALIYKMEKHSRKFPEYYNYFESIEFLAGDIEENISILDDRDALKSETIKKDETVALIKNGYEELSNQIIEYHETIKNVVEEGKNL